METDRELLELAAKASGLRVELVGLNEEDIHFRLKTSNPYWFNWAKWNPLTDDGDALRLAVKLHIWPAPGYCGDKVAIIDGDDAVTFEAPMGDNPYAATRRAIVRAAAEIGRAMP